MGSEFAQEGKIGERFEREAEILQQFRHPNIVRFLAWGKFRGTSYIAMEYVQGETLEKVIVRTAATCRGARWSSWGSRCAMHSITRTSMGSSTAI